MNWHVYNFRGIHQQSFSTQGEALAWINKSPIPSEYHHEYQEKDDG